MMFDDHLKNENPWRFFYKSGVVIALAELDICWRPGGRPRVAMVAIVRFSRVHGDFFLSIDTMTLPVGLL